jgi:hypothetical protein
MSWELWITTPSIVTFREAARVSLIPNSAEKVIICQAAQKCPCLRPAGRGFAQAGRCKLSLRNPVYGGSRCPESGVATNKERHLVTPTS